MNGKHRNLPPKKRPAPEELEPDETKKKKSRVPVEEGSSKSSTGESKSDTAVLVKKGTNSISNRPHDSDATDQKKPVSKDVSAHQPAQAQDEGISNRVPSKQEATNTLAASPPVSTSKTGQGAAPDIAGTVIAPAKGGTASKVPRARKSFVALLIIKSL